MGFRKILASGSLLFPDKCRCINSQYVNTKIGIKENIIEHIIEDRRISIIKVPLVVMKN